MFFHNLTKSDLEMNQCIIWRTVRVIKVKYIITEVTDCDRIITEGCKDPSFCGESMNTL